MRSEGDPRIPTLGSGHAPEPYRTDVAPTQGESIIAQTKSILLISDLTLLRQSFAMLLEWRTGLRAVQADSLVGAGGLLTDPKGDIALAVVSVDTSDGPGTGLIERMRKLGLPVLAFGSEGSTGPLAGALNAGADDAISLGAPVNYLIGKAEQLASKSASQHLS